MEFIKWSDEARLGVATIDEEHQQLAELINHLYCAIQDRLPLSALGALLVDLDVYARKHFVNEEQLMHELGIPVDAMESHIREHRAFTAHIEDLRRDLEGHSERLRLQLWQLGEKWWSRHVLGTDRMLACAPEEAPTKSALH